MERRYESRESPRGDGDLRAMPTGDLVKDVLANAQILLREEIRLAKAEVREEAKKAGRAGAAFGAGGVLVHTALLAFAAFLIAVGWGLMPLWLSALIVCAIFAAAGGIALFYGKKRVETLEPKRPVQSLKEDRKWARDTMQSVKSHRHANA
ncbi:MAG: phage holin family protein [Myxococcaceae bacterium]|nr:phage holin family protein [Myxococcaceae bacterium]